MSEKDWRLKQLETQPWLRGVRFRRKAWAAPREDWDHDHCAACWAKFAQADDGGEILHDGFATTADYFRGADYELVCPACFALFRADMEWSAEELH